MPRQNIPLKDKLKDQDEYGISEWEKDNLDALEAICRYRYRNNLRLLDNYHILQGRFNLNHYLNSNDYYDLTSAIAQELQLPYKLQHYDITTKAVNLLLGEFLKRPDLPRVFSQDEDSTNEKIRVKTELTQTYLQEEIQREVFSKLQAQGLDPNRTEFKNEEEQQEYQQVIQEKYQELTPPNIEKYMRYDYRTSGEHWGQAVLSAVMRNPRFYYKEQEKEEFTHMLASDRCFTHFRLAPEGFRMEPWNPVEVVADESPHVRHAEDGDYICRVYFMSKAQVLDTFGWKMSQEQQESLYPEYKKSLGKDKNGVYGEFFHAELHPHVAYRDYATVADSIGAWMGSFPIGGMDTLRPLDASDVEWDNYHFTQTDIVQVTEGYWRSQRRIGELNLLNPDTGQLEVITVDETFDPKLFGVEEVKASIKDYRENPEPNTICWAWTTQIWQGAKVNYNNSKSADGKRTGIYIDIKPCEFQFKGDHDPFISPKLPVCGQIFNNLNGRSMALVDLLKPYQIFYNALINQAYGVAQRNNGKFLLMDAAVLPRLKDWGGEEAYEKFMAIANSIGLGVIDTRRENVQGSLLANSNGFREVNLDRTEEITRIINLAMLIEQQGFLQIGITPQRQGQIQASETATATNTAVANSYAITEVYFENYNNYKKRKLTMLLDIAQFVQATRKDILLDYITSDLGNAWIKTTGTEILLAELGVIIENSGEAAEQIKLAQQLILQNNTTNIPMSKLISLLRTKSMADMEKSLEQAESDAQKEIQAQREHESQLQQQALEAEAAEKQKDRMLKKYEIDTEAQVEIHKTTLQSIGNEGSYDQEGNTLDRLMSQEQLALDKLKTNSEIALKQQDSTNKLIESFNKAKSEKEKQEKEQLLKSKEFASKEKVTKEQTRQVREQNQNQITLAKMKAENDKAIADKQLELKELEKEIKLLDLKNAEKKTEAEINKLKQKVKLEKELSDLKAESIEKLTNIKVSSEQKLAKVKSKEVVQSTDLKMEENEQQHKFKLKENVEKHKQKLKTIKIKPKIKK